MTQLRPDMDFGSAFIGTSGSILRNSGDLVSVTHTPGSGVYILTWLTPCFDATGSLPIVLLVATPGGDADSTLSIQAVAGQPTQCQVNTRNGGVSGEQSFYITGKRFFT